MPNTSADTSADSTPTTERSSRPRPSISATAKADRTPARSSRTLYTYALPTHTPRNANERQREERQARIAHPGGWRSRLGSINEQLAVWLTKHTGTMLCAYIFAGIGVGSLVGVFTNNTFLAALFGSISSYFLQLVLLPILSVGQNVLSRHAELQADEQFHATMRTLHDIEQVARHLDAQDTELLRQTDLLTSLVQRPGGLGAAPTTAAAATASAASPAPATRALATAAATRRPPRRQR
ncbi:MAG: hypothetical protein ACRDID_24950 [Ktedonobacterales bacterium]